MTAGAAEQFGPYLVFEEIGVGGMASVHRAEMRGVEGFSRPVALKRMLPHCAASPSFVQAFVREARIASHLRHINVAQTYELGKVGEIYFIAMELITGKNLRQVLRHCARWTGPMPVAVTLNILNQICDALDYAHNLRDESGKPLGIIHRDVSPSNILMSDEGIVKLIDFGIAKASAAGMQTTSGLLKGKFGYMAPEYIEGSIDARADLFALGVIAHELLTNQPLFTATDDMETLYRIRTMAVEPPSLTNKNVPPEIDDIVMTALARNPDRRWQQATALHTALNTVTKRLKLECTNAEAVGWIEQAFKQHGALDADLDDEGGTTGVREQLPTEIAPRGEVSRPVQVPSAHLATMARPGTGPAMPAMQPVAQPSPNPAVARMPLRSSGPSGPSGPSAPFGAGDGVEGSGVLIVPPARPAGQTGPRMAIGGPSAQLAAIPSPPAATGPNAALNPSNRPGTSQSPQLMQPLQPPRGSQAPVSTPPNAVTIRPNSRPPSVSPLLAQIAKADAARPPEPTKPRGNGLLIAVTLFVLLAAAAVTYFVLKMS